jgi:hypothetical protein
MATPTIAFAIELTDRLNAAGLDVLLDLETDPDRPHLVLDLVPGMRIAWLDPRCLDHVLTQDARGPIRVVHEGPLAGAEPCDDPYCVAGAIVEWAMQQRAKFWC